MNHKALLFLSSLLIIINTYAAKPSGHERLVLKNTPGLLPKGGHIQGVQMLTIQGKQAIVFSGSSSTYSYYAIAYNDGHSYSVKYVKRIAEVPYKHAGGIQVCGTILAVGIEDNSLRDKSKILLFDISDPGTSDKAPLDSIARNGKYEEATAGAVGITRYGKGYMLAVADWGPNNIDTYISDDIARGNIHFKPFVSWKLQDAVSKGIAPAKWASYQAIQLHAGKDGNITFTGTARSGTKNITTTFDMKMGTAEKPKSMTLENGRNIRYSFSKGVSFRFGGGVLYKDSAVEVMATQRNVRKRIKVDHIY